MQVAEQLFSEIAPGIRYRRGRARKGSVGAWVEQYPEELLQLSAGGEMSDGKSLGMESAARTADPCPCKTAFRTGTPRNVFASSQPVFPREERRGRLCVYSLAARWVRVPLMRVNLVPAVGFSLLLAQVANLPSWTC